MVTRTERFRRGWKGATTEERRVYDRFLWLFKDVTDVLSATPNIADQELLDNVARLLLDSSSGEYQRVAFVKPLRPNDGEQTDLTVVASAGYNREMSGYRFPLHGSLTGEAFLKTTMNEQGFAMLADAAAEPERYHSVTGERDAGSAVAAAIIDNYWSDPYPYAFLHIEAGNPQRFTLPHTIGLKALVEHLEGSRRLTEFLTRDTLTGLYLRPRFMREYGSRLARALRDGEPLSIIYLDVDKMKEVNDGTAFSRENPSPSHQKGDDLLEAIGRGCRQSLNRQEDVGGRIGGDEFVLVLPGLTTEQSTTYLEDHLHPNIERAVNETEQRHPGRLYPRPICSTGTIELQAFLEDGGNPENLLDKADRAMYEMKQRR